MLMSWLAVLAASIREMVTAPFFLAAGDWSGQKHR